MKTIRNSLAGLFIMLIAIAGVLIAPETVKANVAVPTDAPVYVFGTLQEYNITNKEPSWYKLVLPETSVVRSGITVTSTDTSFDKALVQIVTNNGNQILSVEARRGSTNANYCSLLAGTYYIMVKTDDYSSNATGSFICEIIESGQTFPESFGNLTMPNDTISTASEITPSISSIHGIVGGTNTADYYKIDVGNRGALLQVKINSYYNNVCPIKIIDKSLTNTLFDLSSSDKLADCTLHAGTYYIFADCGDNGPKYAQSYDIAIREGDLESYSIKYVLNGGTNSPDNPDSYSEGESLTLADPSQEGYTFDGWYSDSGLTKKVSGIKDTDKGNLTFYAKWNPITYKISYNLDGGKNNPKNKTSYTIQTKTFKLKNAKRKGYKFLGWYDAEGNKVKKILKGSIGDIELTAQWKKK